MTTWRRPLERARGALLVALACLAAGAARADESQPTLAPAMQEQLGADKAAAAAQERVNQLSDETRDLLLRYRQVLAETRSLRDYSDQLAQQVKSQQDEIDYVDGQLDEIDTTAREVLPLMQKMVATLQRFVELDVPFLLDERHKRVASLQEMMAKADVTISEKYRRIIEAYQIETDYGRTLEAYQGEIGEGGDARTVHFLRVGRVALLYQTLDGNETGYWDAQQKGWVVDDSYRSAVQAGFAVAEKKGAPNLLIAPVPAPEESRS